MKQNSAKWEGLSARVCIIVYYAKCKNILCNFCVFLCIFSAPPLTLPLSQSLPDCTISAAKIHWWIVYTCKYLFVLLTESTDSYSFVYLCVCNCSTTQHSMKSRQSTRKSVYCIFQECLSLCLCPNVIAKVQINSHKQIKWQQQQQQQRSKSAFRLCVNFSMKYD